MPWWITYMEIKKNISQWWKIRYLHKLKYAFSFLLAMICSLKHLPTGHLVVLMEKMKSVLLKTQSRERGQLKDSSFHLPEVLRHQNRAVCSVLLLLCHPPVAAQRWAGMQSEKRQPNKNRMQHTNPSASLLHDGRHSFGLFACSFFEAHGNRPCWEAESVSLKPEATWCLLSGELASP